MSAPKVTYARADRVISAIVALLECSDFHDLAREVGEPNAVGILDKAADLARDMRNLKGQR